MSAGTSKIFGIGLSKTGTTSLARALDILGYKTRDYLGVTRYSAGDLSSLDLDEIENSDAFTDTPIPSFYRELNERYPGSKFILTVRNTEGWLKSCRKQFTRKLADKQNEASNQVFMNLYGCTAFDEEKFRAGYERFVAGVKDYFRDRPQDLLILNVTAGDSWEQLCPFLGKPVPDIPFPRANVTRIRWMDVNQLVATAQDAGEQIAEAMNTIRTYSGAPGYGEGKNQARSGSVLGKIGFAVRGGAHGIQARAVKNARRIITGKLEALNPQIPVVSGDSHSVPYAERNKWNHFWLIDLIDEDTDLLKHDELLTLSIALIEDRRPILGVVCAPEIDIVCYATAGKPASKVMRREEPVPLELHSGAVASGSLAACLARGSMPDDGTWFEDTMEWEVAATHVILNSVGRDLREGDAGETLSYNKERLKNDPFTLGSL